jgi:hypothetical protein
MKLTEPQMLITADMCDAASFSINGESSTDEVIAAGFLFDSGAFYAGVEGLKEIAKTLRKLPGRQALKGGQ